MSENELFFNKQIFVYKTELTRYATNFTKQQDILDDTVQETFIKAWEKIEELKEVQSIIAWLKTTLQRRFNDQRKAAKPTEEVNETHAVYTPTYSNEMELIDNELNKLPLIQKLTFQLSNDGYTVREIAAMHKVSPHTVTGRLDLVRKKLRKNLSTIKPDA